MTNTPNSRSARPLAVWPCAQDATRRVWAEIARRAVAHYSEPGDLVVDPLCTDPAAPLEAIRQGRNAVAVIGNELDGRELDQQLRAARPRGATGHAVLLRGDPLELPRMLAQHSGGFLRGGGHRGAAVHPAGSADLVLASLPTPHLLGRQPQRTRQRLPQVDGGDVVTASAIVLRPGGYLVTVTNGGGHARAMRDHGAETVAVCQEIGLAYWQHIVALLVPIEDGRLRSSSRRRSRDTTPGLPVVVHQDVHVFRKPAAAADGTPQRNEVAEARRAA